MPLIKLWYLLIYLVIWWGISGYFFFLFFYSKFTSPKPKREIKDYPSITILVPCYNEEKFVEDKIENLSYLIYPKDKLKILFLDGGSTDNTERLLREKTSHIPYIQIIQTNRKGKINQINFILSRINSEIIVNTDMDGEMAKDALIEIVKEFQSDERIGVVGAYVSPTDTSPEERLYWKNQNRVRILESRVYSSSIIIAVCYAFKRGIITNFPEDVVADDVYLPFQANICGYKAKYTPEAVAYEKRSPNSFVETLRHRFRKSNAYLTEVLRFSYKLSYMSFLWKIIFITKIYHFLVFPWFIMVFFFFTVVLLTLHNYELIIYFLITSIVSLLFSHIILSSVKTDVEEKTAGLILTLKTFFVSVFILIATGLSYPFYRQTSSYKKINS